MDSQAINSETLVAETIIGVIFIALYSYGRYNTPESNRSSTTAGRFLGCWFLYAVTLIGIYWLITVGAQAFPEIIERFSATVSQQGRPRDPPGLYHVREVLVLLRSPITTALLLTALLPNFPLMKNFDRKLLQFFWDLGEIPGHAVKLAHRLYRSRFNLHPAWLPGIEQYGRPYEIDTAQLDLNDRGSPAFVWAVNTSLIQEMEHWEISDAHYKRFLKQREREFDEIKMEHVILSSRISSYYRRLEALRAAAGGVQEELQEDLVADANQRFMRLCKLLAHAVLSIEYGAETRSRRLESLGFDIDLRVKENLSAAQLLQLIALILTVFLTLIGIGSLVRGTALGEAGSVVFLISIWSFNYGISAFFGVYPKTRWRFADAEATGKRPWLGYLFSGVIAVVASLVMIAALRFTRSALGGLSGDAALDKVLTDLAWSYPYLLLSFVIAFTVALLADRGHNRASPTFGRRVDALCMAVVLPVAYVIAYAAMHGPFPWEPTKQVEFRNTGIEHLELLFFGLAHGAIGTLIGSLVPHWYRKNRYRTPVQRVIRFIDRNSHVLKVQSGQLQPGELRQALVASSAAITQADGSIDEIEKNAIRRCLDELAEYKILDFNVEAAMHETMDEIQKSREDHRSTHVSLDAVLPIRGHGKLSELLVQVCAAIACTDGVFEAYEREVVKELIQTLRLDEKKCVVSCGLTS